MRHIIPILIIAASLLAGNATGQGDPFGGSKPSANLIGGATTFLPVSEAYRLEPDMRNGELILNWRIEPGYYLYRHRFEVELATDDGDYRSLPLVFEEGKSQYDAYYEKTLVVYYGQTQVKVRDIPDQGQHRFRVVSQGCADAGLCYPPRTQFISVDFDSGTATVAAAPSTSPKNNPGKGAPEPTLPLMWVLLLALAGGVILNLMPCVFPILSLKALGVATSHLGAHGRHVHGLAYSAGVVTAFVSVAAIMIGLRAGGEALGWGFQLQSPLFVAALAYLFFVMGLGFSGYLELGARLMSLGQSATEGGQLRHSFFTGVLACVVASPCTAPFMGTALGYALTQPAVIAVPVFASLGLGMALPFLLVTWWPWLGRRLPKPGPWMVKVKEFLAFPLYLSAAWLLWVLGRQAGADAAAATVAGAVFLAFALWLARKPTVPRLSGAAAAVALALWLPVSQTATFESEKIWEPYSQRRLEQLLAADRAVFVNLTADWCITCLANERVALKSDSFERLLREQNIVYLKGDWTNYDPEITALLNANGRNGVPLYLFYPAGAEAPEILPQFLTPGTIKRYLSTNSDI